MNRGVKTIVGCIMLNRGAEPMVTRYAKAWRMIHMGFVDSTKASTNADTK